MCEAFQQYAALPRGASSHWVQSVAALHVQGARDGAFRATFEDKPLMSDIIFLR